MPSFTTACGNTAFASPRICPGEARAAVGFTISSAVGARTICGSGCGITPATKSAPNMRQIGRRTPFPRRKSRPSIAIGVCRKDRFDSPPGRSLLSLALKPVVHQLGKLAMLVNRVGIGVMVHQRVDGPAPKWLRAKTVVTSAVFTEVLVGWLVK